MLSSVKGFTKACSRQACLSLLLLRSCLWCLSLDLDRERLCLLLLLSLSLDLDLDLRGIRPAVACNQGNQFAALPVAMRASRSPCRSNPRHGVATHAYHATAVLIGEVGRHRHPSSWFGDCSPIALHVERLEVLPLLWGFAGDGAC